MFISKKLTSRQPLSACTVVGVECTSSLSISHLNIICDKLEFNMINHCIRKAFLSENGLSACITKFIL